jgi:hypothetical protein
MEAIQAASARFFPPSRGYSCSCGGGSASGGGSGIKLCQARRLDACTASDHAVVCGPGKDTEGGNGDYGHQVWPSWNVSLASH